MPEAFSEMSESQVLVHARADCPNGGLFGREQFTEGERLAFARAVGRGDPGMVRLVHGANRLSERVPWSAVQVEDSYAVRGLVDGRLVAVALDFDAKAGSADLAHGDARAVYGLLRGFGIPAVIAASGPSGGRHVLATVREGDDGLGVGTVEMLIEGLKGLHLQTLDVSPLKSGVIRPPGSPHRDGGWSEVLGDRAGALAALQAGAAWSDLVAFIRCLPRASSMRGVRKAVGGAEPVAGFRERTYTSGSEAVFALAMRFVGLGASFEEFEQVARRPGVHPQVEDALARREPGWLKQDWARAVDKAKVNPAKRKATVVDDTDSEVLDSWRATLPTAGLTAEETNAAEVLLDCATTSGKAFAGMSVRGLAERAGEPKSSAARRLKTLEATGLIERVVQGTVQDGARYRLRHASNWDTTAAGTVRSSRTPGGVYLLTVPGTTDAGRLACDRMADVWTREGAGKRGMYAYRHLAAAAADVTTADLAAGLGCSQRAVAGVLKLLERARLARRVGRGVWAAEFNPGPAAAMRLGCLGVNELRRSAYEIERRDEEVRRTRRRLNSKAGREGGHDPLPDRVTVDTSIAAAPCCESNVA